MSRIASMRRPQRSAGDEGGDKPIHGWFSKRRLAQLRRIALRACVMALAATPLPGAYGDFSPAGVGQLGLPQALAAPTVRSLWPHAWPSPGGFQGNRNTPHPAVVRIVVPEGNATSYGSGTLVDVRGEYGLVVTNWHVVRDGHGESEVIFPDGFRSIARPLKVDADWDLAALVIWRPRVAPVKIAAAAPQPGDVLTICGYGSGQYRAATGRCTQYYSPKLNLPQHMVELDVEARQGDSGGPIFNERGELAGVLFGAGQGTTLGSFGGRVEWFLASLAPDIGRGREQALAATAPNQPMRQAKAPPTPPAIAAPVEASITAKVVPPAPANEVAKTGNALASDGTAGRPTPQSPPASATVNHGWHAVAEKKREPAPVAVSMEPVPIVWDVPIQKVLVALGVLALASQLVRVAR